MKRARYLGLLSTLFLMAATAPVKAHEAKEVADLEVLFGAEPEPAVSGQLLALVWRFSSKASKESFGDLEELRATIKRDGKILGPFDIRRFKREPGRVQTYHIFTAGGEYEASLAFRKKGEAQSHSIAFTFQIRDRKGLEIPNE